jgi:ATP-binding cassette subfamily B protein
VISRLINDTALLETVIGSSASMAIRNLLLLAGGLTMLAITSAKLTVLVLAGVPVVVIPIVLFGRRVRRLARATQDRVGDVGAYVDEALHEIRTVQAYGHEPEDRRRFAERVEAAFATALARIKQRAMLVASVILLVFGAIGIILWIGGHDVVAGKLSAGQLSAFVFYAAIVAGAVGTISEVIGDVQRAAGATERLFELLGIEPEIRAPEHPVTMPVPVAGNGRVRKRSLSLSVPAGRGGAGRIQSRRRTRRKARAGRAVRGGQDDGVPAPAALLRSPAGQREDRRRRRAPGRSARSARALAVVPQDPVIFATTVLENVRYGRLDASDEEVRDACDAAFATEFIARMPQQFDSHLGERGVRLSGGQRQRLAIARAILANRPILLLDEATSALDAESERMVQRALEGLMAGRTTLIIAHRLATVRHADRIAVMEAGRLVASARTTSCSRRARFIPAWQPCSSQG